MIGPANRSLPAPWTVKVVTRTINVHNPDGTTHSEKQTVMLSQEIKNNADGTQTVGPWSTAQWEAYAISEIAGYTANPSAVAAQTVNEKTQEQTVDIYYEPVLQQITVNYLDNGKIVGTQILSGYAGETIIPQYRAPKGYEILDQPREALPQPNNKLFKWPFKPRSWRLPKLKVLSEL